MESGIDYKETLVKGKCCVRCGGPLASKMSIDGEQIFYACHNKKCYRFGLLTDAYVKEESLEKPAQSVENKKPNKWWLGIILLAPVIWLGIWSMGSGFGILDGNGKTEGKVFWILIVIAAFGWSWIGLYKLLNKIEKLIRKRNRKES